MTATAPATARVMASRIPLPVAVSERTNPRSHRAFGARKPYGQVRALRLAFGLLEAAALLRTDRNPADLAFWTITRRCRRRPDAGDTLGA
jgi:hypothetical protein